MATHLSGTSSSSSNVITEAWLLDLKDNSVANQLDDPSYWATDPSRLITTSSPTSFRIGTGFRVLSSILPICATAKHEVIIVTCFWAKSTSRDEIASLLRTLSVRGVESGQKIDVRLCFSSISLFQKLFQTTSLSGQIYGPKSWPNLGLPGPEDLGGVDLVVKSVFVRPFSVMHPKFILVDRKIAFVPSCNVSWENWFEGCVEMRGRISDKLFDFWRAFWSRGGADLPASLPKNTDIMLVQDFITPASKSILGLGTFSADQPPISTILLPSPHHMNPCFSLLRSSPPPTPLNLFLLRLFTHARRSIYIQTPNLTSFPMMSALFNALQRGVDIHLVTSTRLMILEQLVTAGTVTEFAIWKLRRRYQQLLSQYNSTLSNPSDPENLMEKPGRLKIGYYHPRPNVIGEDEPVKSHLKLVIMDEEISVLGSGNQDRASWYTSQELGVALLDAKVTCEIMRTVQEGLEGRVDYIC